MTVEKKKEYLAQLNFCRAFLYLGGMLTQSESKKVHDRITRYQDKNRIEISREELDSISITQLKQP